eukprot:CAMPEP_0113844860 /NCGR_PEP_ID=MMETSP0372-20130328/453_1 /TAXON_ID=340204 /ORGANISM="Lankesteria abbotti" /LENGTH=419 /DNA_ID=CAMNT_0000813873 /DNA_START=69 /DNA_END=1328 /DNA_ORIENTATION=+ /assembly_acc=CAM_ASM_000359
MHTDAVHMGMEFSGGDGGDRRRAGSEESTDVFEGLVSYDLTGTPGSGQEPTPPPLHTLPTSIPRPFRPSISPSMSELSSDTSISKSASRAWKKLGSNQKTNSVSDAGKERKDNFLADGSDTADAPPSQRSSRVNVIDDGRKAHEINYKLPHVSSSSSNPTEHADESRASHPQNDPQKIRVQFAGEKLVDVDVTVVENKPPIVMLSSSDVANQVILDVASPSVDSNPRLIVNSPEGVSTSPLVSPSKRLSNVAERLPPRKSSHEATAEREAERDEVIMGAERCRVKFKEGVEVVGLVPEKDGGCPFRVRNFVFKADMDGKILSIERRGKEKQYKCDCADDGTGVVADFGAGTLNVYLPAGLREKHEFLREVTESDLTVVLVVPRHKFPLIVRFKSLREKTQFRNLLCAPCYTSWNVEVRG